MKKNGLCGNCRFLDQAVFQSGQQRRYCSKFYVELKSEAIICKWYQPTDQPSLQDMYNSAWIITKNKKAGFVKSECNWDIPKGDEIRRHYRNPDSPD